MRTKERLEVGYRLMGAYRVLRQSRTGRVRYYLSGGG